MPPLIDARGFGRFVSAARTQAHYNTLQRVSPKTDKQIAIDTKRAEREAIAAARREKEGAALKKAEMALTQERRQQFMATFAKTHTKAQRDTQRAKSDKRS